MSADLLRKAATILRERAEAATPGEWRDIPMGSEGSTILADPPVGRPSITTSRRVGRCPSFADAEYIATMHPDVGLALADLLAQEAGDAAEREQEGHTMGPNWPGVRLARLIVGGAP